MTIGLLANEKFQYMLGSTLKLIGNFKNTNVYFESLKL